MNPFGNPDASKNDIEDEMKYFVDIDSKYFSSNFLKDSNLQRIRFIVGNKGSGKTAFLRRMYGMLPNQGAVYVDRSFSSTIEKPTTAQIVEFSQRYQISELTETWQSLWKCAILQALTLRILYSNELNKYLEIGEKNELNQIASILFPHYTWKVDLYTAVSNILHNIRTKNEFKKYVNNVEWSHAKGCLEGLLNKLPPIYFFVDCIDDEYSHAPLYWMRCQKGLFYECMRFLRDEGFRRFHLVICIRDHVLMSINQSEHLTRYMEDNYVLQLRWDYPAIEYFLKIKIEKLSDCYFAIPGGEKNIKNWLGIDKISNLNRGITENIERYIFRHTRMSPRDIVIVGNALSNHIKRNKTITEGDIRRIVSEKSKAFGNELFRICAAQMNNDLMPDSAGKKGYTEFYTSSDEYSDQTSNVLKEILRDINSEILTWEDILHIKSNIVKKDDSLNNTHFFDVLWQNGAVGFIEDTPNVGEEEFFVVECGYDDIMLPKNKNSYLIRSCLFENVGRKKNFNYSKNVVIGSRLPPEKQENNIHICETTTSSDTKRNDLNEFRMTSAPIFADENKKVYCGTGFFLKCDNRFYIITCSHVLAEYEFCYIMTMSGEMKQLRILYQADISRYSNTNCDVAVLSFVKQEGYMHSITHFSNDMYEGTGSFRAFGYPTRSPIAGEDILFKGNPRSAGQAGLVKYDVEENIEKGYSGSPVINENFQLIGMIQGGFATHGFDALVVPVEKILEKISRLKNLMREKEKGYAKIY